MINDISGLTYDKEMISVLEHYQCPVCLMHMQQQPATMQDNPTYHNVIDEVTEFLNQQIKRLKNSRYRGQIIVDPGIGFGKT